LEAAVMTRGRGTGLLVLGVTVLTFACCGGHRSASTSTSTARKDGTVVGIYGSVGGVAPGPFQPFSNGFVTLTNKANHYLVDISVDGHFRLRAAPGTYAVTGYTDSVGGGTCGSASVRVQANKSVSVTVTCQKA
jgi:hypothetical protein